MDPTIIQVNILWYWTQFSFYFVYLAGFADLVAPILNVLMSDDASLEDNLCDLLHSGDCFSPDDKRSIFTSELAEKINDTAVLVPFKKTRAYLSEEIRHQVRRLLCSTQHSEDHELALGLLQALNNRYHGTVR